MNQQIAKRLSQDRSQRATSCTLASDLPRFSHILTQNNIKTQFHGTQGEIKETINKLETDLKSISFELKCTYFKKKVALNKEIGNDIYPARSRK